MLLLLIVVVLIYWQGPQEKIAADLSAEENKEIIAQVQKHILLPDEETPAIATIENAEELAAQQNFFQDAIDGDKLLVYPKAKKSFIYSPSRDIVVASGPTFFEADIQQSAEQEPIEQQTEKPPQ